MTDYIFIPVGKESGRVFSSTCGTLGYYEPDSPRNIHKINWHSQVTSDLERLYFKYRRHLAIPYWSIVIPLTAISACLLLTKSRKSNQTKFTEPVPNEGATS